MLKHAADLRRRDPLLQSEILDELVAAVGRPGQIYLTNGKPRHDWPLPPLPEGAQVLVLTGPKRCTRCEPTMPMHVGAHRMYRPAPRRASSVVGQRRNNI